ncbi:MAG: metallophosphoesterase [Candidatus Eremiobacterota bacterium]
MKSLIILTLLSVLLFSIGCGSSDTITPLPTVTPVITATATPVITPTVGGSDAYMRKGPYLIPAGDNIGMTVIWQAQTNISADATIEWGSNPNSYGTAYKVTETGSGTDEHQFIYPIKNLPVKSRTYYRVTIFEATGGKAHKYEGFFMTPPVDSSTSLTFYAYGDTRDNPSLHNNILQWIMKDTKANNLTDDRQTFLLHAGDFVHRGLNEQYWDIDYFQLNSNQATSELLKTIPVIACVGNHECYELGSGFHYDPALYRKYWPYEFYKTSKFYYSFDYGPGHFISLDVYTSPYDPNSDQYKWLEEELKKSSKPWTIVLFHDPPYDAGEGAEPEVTSGDGYASKKDIRTYLCPLFEKYGIKIVLNGHQHYYSRSEVPLSTDPSKKITYLVLGGGGAPLVKPDPNAAYVVIAKEDYHFARIEITGNQLQTTVMQVVDGVQTPNILDQFTIQ